ncbi:MAG: hypothetical protein MZV65_45125 [Chromatiales bacterium]|nr:hypothetical protein [Chromatiales bacterium]
MEYRFLSDTLMPEQLRAMSHDELVILATEIRDCIIRVVHENGGHIGPSLGVVELTLALHSVFNTPRDKIIWDVGHQHMHTNWSQGDLVRFKHCAHKADYPVFSNGMNQYMMCLMQDTHRRLFPQQQVCSFSRSAR